jgi:uncharacterized membrane protein
MRTPASVARHPIHPMLVPIPIGLWVFSLICDLIYRFGPGDTVWFTVATYNMVAGIIGALIAAVFGLVDLLALPAAPKKIALTHMAINLLIVVLYVINAWLRIQPGEYTDTPVVMSIVAISLLLVSGWLGGHLVYVHKVAVDTEEDPAVAAGARAAADNQRGRHVGA